MILSSSIYFVLGRLAVGEKPTAKTKLKGILQILNQKSPPKS